MTTQTMMNPLKISVIIPAFNAEKHIGKCLLSLIHQEIPLPEYEIIIINDGSTDSTTKICNEFSNTYCNIKHVVTPNQGIGAARNSGIKIARGEVILFSDADDYWEQNRLLKIYNTIQKHNLDLLLFDYNYYDSQGQLLKGFDYKERIRYPQHIVSGYFFIQSNCLPSTVWTLAYRREYLQNMKFQFINIKHEDVEFIPRVFFFAQKVMYLSLTCYNYMQNETSFMQNYKEANLFDKIKAMESLYKFAKKNIKERTMRLAFEDHISSVLMEDLYYSFKVKSNAQHQMIKQMKTKGIFPLKHAKRKGLSYFMYQYLPSFFIAHCRRKYFRHNHSN